MRLSALIMAILPVSLLAADTSVPVPVRGHTLALTRLQSCGKPSDTAVLFLPGDGGWRGAAVSMGRTIASWGYDVYGFDTKQYLETFSEGGAKLSLQQVASDVRLVANQIGEASHRRVVLVGWSQGGSMAVAAVSGVKSVAPIQGVITLGLPESGVLGWDWKATLAIVARREPDEPKFAVKPLLSRESPVPVWMIHGSEDEYTSPEVARALFQAATEPKRLDEITGANHRFEGHQSELYRSLRKGLAWIAST